MPTKEKSYQSILTTLKDKLSNNTMSVLVGAGFSKNFDKEIFPDWYQLIFEMVRDSEEERLKEEFEFANKKKKVTEQDYQDFLKAKIWTIVQKVGPLKAVSDFIKRKGYREAADIRIEGKTPAINIEEDIQFISYWKDGIYVKRPVKSEEMRIHRKLVNLPWNNIYTTNYDNLLENSIDLEVETEINSKKTYLEEEITSLTKTLQQKDNELSKAKEDLLAFDEFLNDDIKVNTLSPVDPGSSVNTQKRNEILRSINNLDRDAINLKWQIKKLSETLADLIKIFARRSLVKHSSDLALKKNGNIIKIHGSIRTENDMIYGFDSDARNHYVISQEDFDDYPIKHAAFTQLMRISLLQESFCLMGFSGIDPNFLAWIGWVRDIVQRKENYKETDDYKIYLIDITSEDVDKERSLFHENHRIVYLPLANPECLSFLENEVGRILPKNPEVKEYIEIFLDFLNKDRTPNELKIGFEIFQIDEYKRLWGNIPRGGEEINNENFPEIFGNDKQIEKLKESNRIPLIDGHTNTIKYHFLRSFDTYLNLFEDDKTKLEQILKVAIAIISDQLMPHRILFHDVPHLFERLKKLAKSVSQQLYERFLLFDLKDSVWDNDLKRSQKLFHQLSDALEPAIINETIYQKILFAAFNFKFGQALEILESWEPPAHWIVKKAGLLSILSPDDALKALKGKEQESIQESLFQLEMLSYLSLANFRIEERTKYFQQTKAITNLGLESLHDKIDYFMERIHKQEGKIIPYGDNKFTNSRSITFGGPNKFLDGLQLLNLLSETGFPLSMPRAYLEDFKRVHVIFEHTFTEYPYPTLFYIFQYSEEKAVIRMAQEYVYSEKLEALIPGLFKNFVRLYHDEKAPSRFKSNCILFLSELILVMEPFVWKELYIQVWNEEKESKTLFSERQLNKNYFIESGLHFVNDPDIVAQIINDSLSAVLSKDSNIEKNSAIQYLYELNFNHSLSFKAKEINKNLDNEVINTLIDSISLNLDTLFLLGNISFVLNKTQQLKVQKALINLENFNTNSERIWRIILAIGKGNQELIDKIKPQILNSPKLWDAGFKPDGSLSYSNQFISLYKLRRFKSNYGIIWNQEELEIIYLRMIEELEKIEKWLQKDRDSLLNFSTIAEEMTWFINFENSRLKKLKHFAEIKERIRQLFILEKQYDSIIQGLLSVEKLSFTTALGEVSYDLYNNRRFKENEFYIRIILNKIIFKTDPGLAEALETATEWMYVFRNQRELKKFQPLLELILETFAQTLPQNIDIPSIEEAMVKIAFVLRVWQSKKPIVQQNLNLLETSRFNNIRYNLKYKLKVGIPA